MDHVYFSPLKPTVDQQSADRRQWISLKSFITISRMKEIIAFMPEVIKSDFLQESGLRRGHNSVSPTISPGVQKGGGGGGGKGGKGGGKGGRGGRGYSHI